MQVSEDEARRCEFCGKPATTVYACGNAALSTCDACHEQQTVREAHERQLVHVIELTMRRQYDEALAFLDALLESNRERDQDAWLARHIAHHRVQILWDTGRYAEAEQACEAWAELGFVDIGERLIHALETARILEVSGRVQQALDALENALGHGETLGHDDVKYLDSAPYPLAELARLSDKLGQPVDPKWRRLAEAVADEYGVEMPIKESLGQALLALEGLTRGAKPKRQREWEAEHGADADE